MQMFIDADRSWFYKEPERFLQQPDFVEFQDKSGVDFRDLLEEKPPELKQAGQQKLVEQCVILNEIRKQHFGYAFPLLVYTHWLGLCDGNTLEKVPKHNVELDKIILAFDMTDSLRRRHLALSSAIIPSAIEEVYSERKEPILIKNLGSGAGLDTIRATREQNGRVAAVLNYDKAEPAIRLGEAVTHYLEEKAQLEQGVVKYLRASLTESREPADLIVYVGIICGLHDDFAYKVLRGGYQQLKPGGKVVVSSSNQNMRDRDPLASFLIQHIGSRDDASKPWSLNFREKGTMQDLLLRAGFRDVKIYDDSNFEGRDSMDNASLYSVERLPAMAMGSHEPYEPLRLPPEQVLEKRVGYNWIAIGTR